MRNTGRKNWWPCRVCGVEHQNPMSSSLCQPCGIAEREERERRAQALREAYASSPLGQFMAMSESDRWQELFERLNALESTAR